MCNYPSADVTAAIRRFAYKPVDDSDFTNEIFFPEMVDFLYGLPEEKRRLVQDDCKDVNYAVVDLALIRRIYKAMYQQKVLGETRARIRSYMHLESLLETGGAVIARFRDLLHDRDVTLEADGLIVCTGYTWRKQHPLLQDLAPYLARDGKGRLPGRAQLPGGGRSQARRRCLPPGFRRGDPRRQRDRAVASARAGRRHRTQPAFRARGRRELHDLTRGCDRRRIDRMHIQRLDPEKLFEAYGVQVQMLYPWQDVVEPPFGAAWAVVPPGGSTKHHAHQEGETFFVRGRGVMRVGDESVEVQAGDVTFHDPFDHHTLTNTSDSEELVFLTVWWEDSGCGRTRNEIPWPRAQ